MHLAVWLCLDQLGELTALPQSPSWIWEMGWKGRTMDRGKGKEVRRWASGEGEG